MRDYAELINAVRGCSGEFCYPGLCPRFFSSPHTSPECIEQLRADAADAIEELLAAVPHWISVEERLPEKDETVIVYYSWTGQSGTVYKEVSLATVGEMKYCGNKLIGWMPLPTPPKEDAE